MPGNGVLIEQRFPLPRGLVRRLDRLAVQFGLTRLEVVTQLLDRGTRGVTDRRRQRARRMPLALDDTCPGCKHLVGNCQCEVHALYSSAPCAHCGQDPDVGHNRGCPDGAGLG